MAGRNSDPTDRKNGPEPEDRDLSRRLRQLEEKLGSVPKASEAEQPASVDGKDSPSTIAAAMRLSSEFVAGIVAGGGIGWAVDTWFGTKPWGLIIFLMLGFGAGISNVVRASGILGKRS